MAFTNPAIVIDNGSGVIKAGFAGDHIPKCHFPNYVGRPKWDKVMATGLDGDIFVGSKAEENRGIMQLRYPMESGIVTDWSDMERVWKSLYTKDHLNARADEHPVLLTEVPNNPNIQRERAAEIFFETFNAPAMHFSAQALLSLYATGRTSGIVLDCGDGVCHAVPIYEGFSVAHGATRSNVAGRHVTSYLRWLLQKEGHDFTTTSEFEVVREIKEQACYLSLNAENEEQNYRGTPNANKTSKFLYKLPDGRSIALGSSRFRAPELLFKPYLYGYESQGVHEVLLNAIQKVDLDVRKSFYTNIVLSGGSTLVKGFGDRLLNEIKCDLPSNTNVRISAPQERLYSCWIGGSILAALGTWRKMWITKQEYESDGMRAVHKKCFG